ncbi:MAG: hypothetical protein ACXAC7_20725 [Candidatus Hodarchaeales archaeon]|jgi:hypothetical protein
MSRSRNNADKIGIVPNDNPPITTNPSQKYFLEDSSISTPKSKFYLKEN